MHTHTHLALCLQPNAKSGALTLIEGEMNQVGGANMQLGAWSLTRGRSCQCQQKVDFKGIRAFLTRHTYCFYYILYYAPKLLLLTRTCTCAQKVSHALLDFSLSELLVKVKNQRFQLPQHPGQSSAAKTQHKTSEATDTSESIEKASNRGPVIETLFFFFRPSDFEQLSSSSSGQRVLFFSRP